MPLTFQGVQDAVNLYRDTETGDLQTSVDIINTALGNPVEPGEISIEGHTAFENGDQVSDRLYNETMPTRSFVVNEGTSEEFTVKSGDSPKSRFNTWNLLRYKSIALNNLDDSAPINVEDYEKSIIRPDSPSINPTARTIVNWAQDNDSLAYSYRLEDFIQCEYYGTVPNNYMLTLRRFPYPCKDDILSPKDFGENGTVVDTQQPDIARAITWISPSLGNSLTDIIRFDVGFNWKEEKSKVQEIQNPSGDNRGKVGARISASPLLSAIEEGLAGRTAAQTERKKQLGPGHDPLNGTYPNSVYGQYNVIDQVLVRDKGLKFTQDFTLTFHYDLKAYGNTSPRVAFMDTLANLLVLTYNNAPFWGGSARFYGGSGKKPFGDFSKLKSGDYKGFLGSVMDQFTSSASNLMDDLKKGLGDSKVLDQIVGGGLMELFGSPQGGAVIQAFLTGDPTGQWHLTVGNPMNPVMVIGNLCMQDAKFEFEGPLGYEDFPTKLKLTVTLRPGRPRDKADIESMFNAGKSRIYLQPEGFDEVDTLDVNQYGKAKGKLSRNLARNISDMAQG